MGTTPRPVVRWGIRVFTVGVSLAVSLLFTEIGARALLGAGLFRDATRLMFAHLAWPLGSMPPYFREDADHGTATVPGLHNVRYFFEGGAYTVSTVALGRPPMGFRTASPEGPVFATAVGDSHTFCVTVESAECWVTLLGHHLGVSIANLGIPGSGATSHALVLERYGEPLRPRLVIWQFTTNDPLDDLALVRRQRGHGGVVPAVKRWLTYHSFSYNALKLAVPSQAAAWSSRMVEVGNAHLVLSRRHYSSADRWDADFREGWELSKRAIVRGKRAADAMGARFLVVLIPYREEVYRDVLARIFPDAPLLAPEDEVSARLRAFLDGERIAWIDTAPALRIAAVRGEAIYHAADAHLTPRGNEIVGLAVTAEIGRP